jgi:hypothetical protein
MNDNDHYILDVWLSGEGTVRATNAVSGPDNHWQADERRLSIIISGSIDTDSHPWAKTFKKIDVTLYFSDENPVHDGCAFLSASGVCLEGDVVYRDSLDIEAFLPTASFTMVSQILTSSRTGRPLLFLLTDDDIAAWAAQDEPELLKAQECAFDYDTQPPAVIEEQVPDAVTEQTGVDTAPRRRRRRRKEKVELPVSWGTVLLGALLFVIIIILFLAPIYFGVDE